MHNLPRLVKQTTIINNYPGYMYIFFKTFDEIDDYFRQEYGSNWRDEEWAKVWLRGIWKENRTSRANGISKIQKPKPEKVSKKHFIRTLCKSYALQDKPPEDIIAEIKQTHGITVREKTLFLYAGRAYTRKFKKDE